MSKINVLDFSVANLIAAGEVVDRPASAIKEMLENSLDAGAKHISVEIRNGGISLMKISDDGCGMSREDVPVAIKRHATSKIKNAEDLDGILTLGFRGEALAAISSVSKLTIITKSPEEDYGTKLVSEFGEIISVEETGCHDGTTVIVQELFSNTPARRKFLKKDSSEAMAVSAVIEKLALSRPDVAFHLVIDNNVKTDTTGDGKLLNAIYSVFGRDFAKKMLPVQNMTEGIAVDGFIGAPDNVRGNRNCQNFFINHRYIKSNAITAAVEEAFNSYIPSERFPCCVLNITIHPAFVDVNVHPTKLEVKFSNERIVFNAVYCAVRNVLIDRVRRPEMELGNGNIMTGRDVRIINAFTSVNDRVTEDREKKEEKENLFTPEEPDLTPPKIPVYTQTSKISETLSSNFEKYKSDILSHTEEKNPDNFEASPIASEKPENVNGHNYTEQSATEETRKEKPIPSYRIIGCAFNAYIMVEMEERVLLIDKHAAHERIIFEEMKKNMNSEEKYSQILLIPSEIFFGPSELQTLKDNEDNIKKLGVDFEILEDKIILKAYPCQLDEEQTVALIEELAAGLDDGTTDVARSGSIAFEKKLYQASCKAAMKAGREDSEENQKWICDRILSLDNIKFCPHGRPVAFDLTKHEIERQFKRV